MIQRIQTIYLLLAFTCAVLLLFVPLFSVSAVNEDIDMESISAEFGAHGLYFTNTADTAEEGLIQDAVFESITDRPAGGKFPVFYIYISLSLFTLAAVLLYKNRKRQLMITRLSLFLHILVVIGIYAFYYLGTSMIKKALPESAEVTITFGLQAGFYLMIATIPFLFLAIRGIKHDENLVKSLDRLR